jgi:predicted porin
MQKKLIALAIAGLASTAAFAQSNVTVYGVADASLENVSATGATASSTTTNGISLPSRNRVQSNSSYIGFKGTEALGNGINGIFQLESQFAADNAVNSSSGGSVNTVAPGTTVGGTLATRDTFVGVNGAFGTVKLGHVSTPHRLVAATFDVMPGATGVAGFNSMIGRINVGATPVDGTTTNSLTAANNLNAIYRTQAINYDSPVFGGFSGSLLYAANENRATDSTVVAKLNAQSWNAALKYGNGPLNAAYSYLIQEDGSTTSSATNAGLGTKLKSHLLAANYVFNGATTVSVMYNQNILAVDSASTNEYKNAVWWLGVKHVMGAHELAGMYAVANDGSVSNIGTGAATASDRGANQLGLRYAYNFSKRTSLYAVATRITNKSNGTYDFGAGTAVGANNAGTSNALQAGVDPQAFGLGLRHSF